MISHIGNFKCFRGHVKKKKKSSETGEINFKGMCYLTQHVQNTIISACNQRKHC